MTTSRILAAVLGVAVWASPTPAADSERAGKWQTSIPITFTSGVSYDAEAQTSVDIQDDVGWGFGFGYHLNPNLLLGTEFTWLSANYDASISTDNNADFIPDTEVTVSGTLDATNWQFFGQWNILKGRFTPFLRGSFGWTWVDSNIPAGPTTGTCWWDPWWGYVCNTWQPTFGDTAFSYGAGLGVRAELTPQFFVEGSYNLLWVDFDNSDTPSLDGWRMNIGWTF